MSISLENLRRDIRTRIESDQLVSTAWILVPLLEVVALIIFILVIILLLVQFVIAVQLQNPAGLPRAPELAGVVNTYRSVAFILGLVFAYPVYKLIKRRNTHFARQVLLYEDLTSMAKELGAKKGVEVSLSLNNLDRAAREAKSEETEKNAFLWTILTLATTAAALDAGAGAGLGLSFLGTLTTFYVFYFLMRDLYNHERREDMFFDELSRTLMALGVMPGLPRRMSPTPSRSFALYVLLTIVTVRFFWVYWVYTLINDPNNHFRQQAFIEDTALAQITPLMN